MQRRNKRFGDLLKAGTAAIGYVTNKTQVGVEEDLGASLGVAGVTIERYKAGYLPPERGIALIAERCVDTGLMGQRWLEQFLASADIPTFSRDALVQQMFPNDSHDHTPVPRSNVPYLNVPAFVRRDDMLEDVLHALDAPHAVTILLGMGGIGKTTLAINAAAQYCKVTTEQCLVAWVSDRDNPGTCHLSQVLETLIRVLDYPGLLSLSFEERSRAVGMLLSKFAVLLVIDNADTIKDESLFEWVSRVPPPSKALLTSRCPLPAIAHGYEIDIRPMSAAEQQQFVSAYLQQPRLRRHGITPADAMPLLASAGGNPKAIALMLGMVQHCSAQDILGELTIRDQLFNDLFMQTWHRLRPDAHLVLIVLTFFAQSVPASALAFCADLSQHAFVRIADDLTDHALLDTERTTFSAPPLYLLHPLVRAFVESQIAELSPSKEYALRDRWLTWCMDAVEAVGFCWDDLHRLEALDHLYPTIQDAIVWADTHARYDAVLTLTEHVRYYTNVRGLWSERELQHYEQQARAAQALGNVEDEIVALARYVQILSKQGNITAAGLVRNRLLTAGESFYAMHIQSMRCAEPHRYTRIDEAAFEYGHALALHARAQQQFALAESHWRRLLRLSTVIGGQHYVVNRRWMGIILLEQDRTDEAIQWLTQSLEDARAINDVRSIIGNTLKLAALAVERGDYNNAAPLLEDARRIAAQHHDRRRLAEYHRLSARIALAQDDRDRAEQELQVALDLFTRLHMQPDIAMTQYTLRRLNRSLL